MRSDLARRDALIAAALGLVVGTALAALLKAPGYTDAYYYFNAGQRLVQGKGLTDAALWTYLGAPAGLPAPAHLYWMPLPSLVAALGMWVAGPSFDAAQIGFVILYAGLGTVGFALGALVGGTRRTAWMAALLTLFSGYYAIYWTTTSSFAPFGLAGSLALLAMGLGRRSGRVAWFALSGAMSGLAHLTRADGVLLLGVLIVVALWPPVGRSALLAAGLGIAAYVLVMSPWFVRNLAITGAILPPNGLQTAWMRSYDEIANYPPAISLSDFLAWGAGNIVQSRWSALVENTQRFIAEQGIIVLTPLMLYGLWRRRFDPLVNGVLLYAPGLFLTMTLIFAFPGSRGGLFHSAAALVPFWSALAVAGLDELLVWAAPRRRWRLAQARGVFGTALIVWAVGFSMLTFLGKTAAFNTAGTYFQQVARTLPADAVVMINDPAALYYFTGLSGVVVPNAPAKVIPELARRYGVTYVVLDDNVTWPLRPVFDGQEMPPFLEPLPGGDGFKVYRIRL